LVTSFIHFSGCGVINRIFMDAVGIGLIVPLLGIVPHPSIC